MLHDMNKRASAYGITALIALALALLVTVTSSSDWSRPIALVLVLCAVALLGGAAALAEFTGKMIPASAAKVASPQHHDNAAGST